ncbi:hypothetical protein C366_06794 [Cryptococcus neoformans Tu401-1]|nr:hypothetical protein C366_06794 [Cryptococcus neoformans var. grubii Tu401-1]
MACNCPPQKNTACCSTSEAQDKCTCQKGNCECKACPNSTKTSESGGKASTCNCGGSGEACTCPPGQCACDKCPKKAKSVSTCGELAELVATKGSAVALARPALVRLASVHVTTAPSRLKRKSAPALAADLALPELVFQTNAPVIIV